MEERRRLQKQLDKAVVMNNAIQKQIDNILSSNMDMLIVDAMRGFNQAATSMVLPQRLTEVENLGDQLADRQSEVIAMQDAIMGIGVNCMDGNDDVDIWQELDDLMAVDAPADAFVAAEQRADEPTVAAEQPTAAAEQPTVAAEQPTVAAEQRAEAAAERREADRAAKVDTSTLMSA
jgi:hypothetical protein